MEVDSLYHERQVLALCAVHAVNNLLQCRRFTKRDFDRACLTLAPRNQWRNPHRGMLRMGDFDLNAITMLLQQEGYSVTWHNQRASIELKNLEHAIGILWNVQATSSWSRLFGGRHWIALLCEDNCWVNLDSILAAPALIGSSADCVQLLSTVPDAHIIFVTRDEIPTNPFVDP